MYACDLAVHCDVPDVLKEITHKITSLCVHVFEMKSYCVKKKIILTRSHSLQVLPVWMQWARCRFLGSVNVNHDFAARCQIRNVSTCVNMCQHVSTCVNMCKHVSTCVNVCQHVSMCVNMCKHVPTCVNLCKHVSTSVNMYKHASTCVNTSQRVSTCLNMCQRASVLPLSGGKYRFFPLSRFLVFWMKWPSF